MVAAGLAALLPLGWIGYRATAAIREGGLASLTSISLLPDSHDKLFADYLKLQERSVKNQLDAPATVDQAYIDNARDQRTKLDQQFRSLLLRAVRLGEVDPAKQAAFEQRQKECTERLHKQLAAKPRTYSEDERKLLNSMFSKEQSAAMDKAAFATARYLAGGMLPLREPETEFERLYVEELQLVRESLEILAGVSSKRHLPTTGQKLEALTDRMLENAIAQTRGGIGLRMVNRNYISIDELFDDVSAVLQDRIQSEFGTDQVLEHANEHFAFARRLTLSWNAPEEDLRKRLADARAEKQSSAIATTTSPPTPAPVLASASSATAPGTPAAPVQVASPVQDAAPAQDTAPALTPEPKDISQSRDSAEPPSDPEPVPPSAAPETIALSSPSDLGRRGPLGPSFREPPQRGFTPPQAEGPPSRMLEPFAGGPNRPQQDMTALRASFEGPDSAKVIFTSFADAHQACQRMMQRLNIAQYLIHSSNGESTLMLKFDGPLEELAQAVDFGTVTRHDEANRVLYVKPH